LKFSTKLQETLEFMKKETIRLDIAFLAFTTQAIEGSQMFPGLIQHLWYDLLECSSSLVPQISNVSWVLSIHTVLDVTSNKQVKWARVGQIGRPSSGSPTTTPILIEILVKELTHLKEAVRRCSVLLEDRPKELFLLQKRKTSALCGVYLWLFPGTIEVNNTTICTRNKRWFYFIAEFIQQETYTYTSRVWSYMSSGDLNSKNFNPIYCGRNNYISDVRVILLVSSWTRF
jgi:hypothetical protein